MITLRTKLKTNRYRERARQAHRSLGEWNAKHAGVMAKTARQLVAVDTGETRDSIAVVLNRRTGRATVMVGGASLFLEFGTVHRSPQPFFLPSLEIAKKGMRGRAVRIYR